MAEVVAPAEGPAEEEREGFSARAAFLCATIGSAVGLGNVWRFPNYTYAYGGGAFLLPFLLAMVFIGIPILTLEFALGQVFRSGDAAAFAAMNKRLRGVGLGSIWCGFNVVCFYVCIIAWAACMLFHSFRGVDGFIWSEGAGPGAFFENEIIGMQSAAVVAASPRSTNLVPHTWLGVTLIWIVIFLCTFKGPKMAGRITYFTMLIPFLLIVVLAIVFSSLEGAQSGLDLYMGKFDFAMLSGSDLKCGGGTKACNQAWPDAVSQVFFSLGVTFGTMTAYASYNPKGQGVQVDALICAFGDLFCSIVAGLAVFASIGVLANATGRDAKDAAGGSASFGLAFVSMPAAFESLMNPPYSWSLGSAKFLAILFYLTLVLLGVDSAFSLCEGFSTCMRDSRFFKDMQRETLVGAICFAGYCVSLVLYCPHNGIKALDVVDHYINISMLFVGFMECVSAAWVAYCQEQMELIGQKAWRIVFCSMLAANFLGPWIGLGIGDYSEEGWWGTVAGILVYLFIFVGGIAVACRVAMTEKKRPMSKELLYDVLMFNVEKLRSTINGVCGGGVGNLSIPLVWSLLLKFCIPPILMLMLLVKMTAKDFGFYADYSNPYQYLGMAVALVPFVAMVVGIIWPHVFDIFMPEKEMSLDDLLADDNATATKDPATHVDVSL